MTRRVNEESGMAQCTHCKEWKEFDEFHADKHSRYGFAARCKSCANRIHTHYKDARQARLEEEHDLALLEFHVLETYGEPPQD